MSVSELEQSGIEPLCLTVRNFVKAQTEAGPCGESMGAQSTTAVRKFHVSWRTIRWPRQGLLCTSRKQSRIPLETGEVRAKVL
jgi:hypothetical protein